MTTSKQSEALLFAGYLGPLAYLIHDIVGAFLSRTSFSLIENTVSDLTNSAARSDYTLGVLLLIASALMGMLFGAGILTLFTRVQYRVLHNAGMIVFITGTLQLFTATVFPQDPIGSSLSNSGLMHLIIVGISAILAILLLISVGRWSCRKPTLHFFSIMTITTLILLVSGGIITALVVSRQIPVLGLVERLSVYPFQCWTMLFAYQLFQISKNSNQSTCCCSPNDSSHSK